MRCGLTMPLGRAEESWVLALADCPMSRLLARSAESTAPATARFHVAILHAIDTVNDEGRLLPEAARLLHAAQGDVDEAHAHGGEGLRRILLELEETRQAELRRRSPIQRAGGPVAVAAMTTAATVFFLWGLSRLLQTTDPHPSEPRIESIAWVEGASPRTGRRKLEIAFAGDFHPIVTMVLAGGKSVRLDPPPSRQRTRTLPPRGPRTVRLPEDGPGWALPEDAVLVIVSDEASTPTDLPARIAALPLLPVWLEAEIPGVKAIRVGARTP